jgi:hypothetical protein
MPGHEYEIYILCYRYIDEQIIFRNCADSTDAYESAGKFKVSAWFGKNSEFNRGMLPVIN